MEKELIISDFQKGISSSPHMGHADMRNVDIFTVPGTVMLNNPLAKKSGTTVTATPVWFDRNPLLSSQVFCLDSTQKLYVSTDNGDTWALVSGNGAGAGAGLRIWKDYAFVARATTLDVLGPLSTATFASATFIVASQADDTIQAAGSTSLWQTEATPVRVSSTTTLPTGLSANTTYWTKTAGSTLFRFYPTAADAVAGTNQINISSDGTGTHTIQSWYWTLSWKTIDTDTWHPMKVSINDGKLYGGAGKYVFSLDENAAPFVPATAGSYTWTQQALDLPANYRIKCLEELGDNLMCGTWMGTNYGDFKIADIFPWDRSSPSFGQPLSMNVNGVHAMLTMNNILYILAGLEGKIYSSNGVQSATLGQLPYFITNTSSTTSTRNVIPYPGSLVNYKERPFFGFGYGVGVWSILPTSNGNILNLEHTMSTGVVTNNTIGALLPISQDQLLVGWGDLTETANYGIDKTNNAIKITTYAGYVDSAFYRVGTYHFKKQFTEIEFQLAKPLVAGQGVKLEYRTDLTASFTTIGTYDYAGIGAIGSYVATASIPACEFVQIRASLAPGSSATNASPELRAIILR